MPDLCVTSQGIDLPVRFAERFCGALKAEGLHRGEITIGSVLSQPNVAFILWNDSGESPVSMLVLREDLFDQPNFAALAHEFAQKWKERE